MHIGDFVTRNSHDNDTVFVILEIKDNVAILKGIDVRLYADSPLSDLILAPNDEEESDKFAEKVIDDIEMDRSDFFYLPGKILHIDGDNDYLERCMNFYKKANVLAVGKNLSEDKISNEIVSLLKQYNPDIVIITGHDAYYKRLGNIKDSHSYKNSLNFVNAVKKARMYEKSHDKLVIIAGACQSNYEELIKAGANFASSPKRINIHALDPAIIATTVALTERNKEIDLPLLLDKTKYGKNGMGGLVSNGLMFVGYPR
ncbi:MAG: sporulation peptidase YabG [Bacilli bacterium]